MDALGPIIEIVKCFGAPACKCLKNHRKLDEYMNVLTDKLEELNGRKRDNKRQLDAELHPGKIKKETVEKWFKDVEKINSDARNIEDRVKKGKYLRRACLAELVNEKILVVNELLRRDVFAGGLTVDKSPIATRGQEWPPFELVGEADVEGAVWSYLMSDDIGKIGVYGLGGVGKTTIMKHIHNRLLKETCFEKVAWVTVSKDYELSRIEKDIASAFGKKLEDDDPARQAAMIFEMLKDKRFVLILDDVWKTFDLAEVGIPEPSVSNGCKLVFTTRNKDVCRSMDCKMVEVNPLPQEEAKRLFLEKVGFDVFRHLTLGSIAEQVLKECDGLPLAIALVGSCMRNDDDIHTWNDALNELQGGDQRWLDVEKKVLLRLKFSYDHLKDVKAQHCFLYCCLYPEDFEISKEELIQYWALEGHVDDRSSSQAIHRYHTILSKLINCCLLEECGAFNQRVKMHDLIREMALYITRESPRFMVKAGLQLTKSPKDSEWVEELEKVSLMYNHIQEFPRGVNPPKCQRLTTLLLQMNSNLKSIPHSFFMHLLGLKILDLSGTGIKYLPDSTSNLVNLTALLLRDCRCLVHVPCLSKLKELQKLDLCHTHIKKLPLGMDRLVKLSYLDIDTRTLKELPAGLLRKLVSLQQLSWRQHGEDLKFSGEEFANLLKLERFEGGLCDQQGCNVLVKSMEGRGAICYYVLRTEKQEGFSSFSMYGKTVELDEFCFVSGGREADPVLLPTDVRQLRIIRCHDPHFRSLGDIPSVHSASSLKWCEIDNCDFVEYFFNFSSSVLSPSSSSLSSYSAPLESLEEIRLERLENLKALIEVEQEDPQSPFIPQGIFSSLKKIRVNNCHRIKRLFFSHLLRNLLNLEEIWVSECNQMEEIIGTEGDDGGIEYILLKLMSLQLISLPELKSICPPKGLILCDSIQTVEIWGCPLLKILPLSLPLLDNGQLSRPPFLEKITGREDWWNSLEWDHADAGDVLQPIYRSLRSCVLLSRSPKNLVYPEFIQEKE